MVFALGVVHYQNPAAVRRLLAEVLSWSRRPERCYVVDNSGDLEAERWPEQIDGLNITVISPGSNVGYGAAVNIALTACAGAGIPYILLVTQDAHLNADVSERLEKVLDAEARVAVAAPLLAFASRPAVTFSAGGFLHSDGRFNHRSALQPVAVNLHRGEHDVDWVDGACLMVRVSAVVEIGMMPEEYFLYAEDVDFGLQLRLAQWLIRLDTSALAFQEPGDFKRYYRGRNLLHFLMKHRGRFRKYAIPMFVIKELAHAAKTMKMYDFYWTSRGLLDAMRGRMGPPPRRLMRIGRHPN